MGWTLGWLNECYLTDLPISRLGAHFFACMLDRSFVLVSEGVISLVSICSSVCRPVTRKGN